MRKISVLLVDDHTVVCQGLSFLLKATMDIEVVGQAANGRQALAQAKALQPAVILMDLSMPHLNGIDATAAILRDLPQTKIIVLTTYGDDENVHRAIAAGAVGFILKQAAACDLIQAIREVYRGNAFFSPVIARRLRDQSPSGKRCKKRSLTLREAQILQLISEGLANKQMASHLGISMKTVEKHRQQLMNKLGIHETAGLTRYALSHPNLLPAAPAPAHT